MPGDALDLLAQERMSTVYFPGGKIKMLPSTVIDVFSLNAGQARPAISLYITLLNNGELDPAVPPRSVIEKVWMDTNVRLNQIEHLVNETSIEDISRLDILYRHELSILWKATQHLHGLRQKARIAQGQREEKIGPPDANALPRDFHFAILNESGQILSADRLLQKDIDDQSWQPEITSRQRGSVIDSIVSEWMIFCNQTWGSLLADHELPAIYRAQQGWGPQRTRMQTTPCRHEGLGVENYAWCTSPLRRYADLVNQWQLIAYIQQGVMAKLVAPFVAKDTKIMSLCAEFDTTYNAYNAYQQIAEKYWCLRWIAARDLPWTGVVRVMKEGMVRIELIPLRLFVPELMQAARGSRVTVEIMSIDLLMLSASVRVIELLEHHQEFDEVEVDIIEPVIEIAVDESVVTNNDANSN